MTDSATERAAVRSETWLVACVALALSLMALAYCFPRGMLLLYGDAVAHLHIARRVFDSLDPGYKQLGSVWLPLSHILLIPFVQKMSWWQTGLAGAWPSMACYVLGCVGIYRLARVWLRPAAALVAIAFFALNPGLLYMQTTAMTEPLFLAEMVWSVLLLTEYIQALKAADAARASRLLIGLGFVLSGSVYTRYDGWIFAFIAWVIVLWNLRRYWRSRAGGAFLLFTAILVTAPLLWMAYNARQFGDPLDFMRGPYSAKAIEERTATPGSPHYPGWHSMRVAALYFLKAAEIGAAPVRFANLVLWLSIAGSIAAGWKWRGQHIAPALLFWVPLPFYAYSIAYGSVPIFIPLWWPHSWYNTRYGMEMLPAFALFLAFLIAWAGKQWPRAQRWTIVAALALIAADSFTLMRERPVVLAEAVANSRTRIPYEESLAEALKSLPQQGMILMYTSEHIGALQRAGIPLKRTINETDYYQWPAALQYPAKAASIVVATDHDAVAKAIEAHPEGLTLVDVVCSTGQPCARIYLAK